MMSFSDGFIILPGRIGTLEEIFTIWNALKLKIHNKPLGLLNIDNYFNKLIEFIDHSINEEFSPQHSQSLITMSNDPALLIKKLL